MREVGPLISVCILAGHGLDALERCLASLEAQDSPPPFELLVGGNGPSEVASVVHRHFPAAQVCRTGGRLPGAARNPLIERARGELLLFLDDDVTVSSDLLRQLADTAAEHPEASVFGGPNGTPPGSSRFQVVQGAVLSSLMGAGPVSRRYGARHAGLADERWFTLCNLAVRRRVMAPFKHDLVCAEENALLAELRARGEAMRYEPALRVFHDRRAAPRSFARQMFKYGRGRGQLLRRQPRTARAAYLAPSALLTYLLIVIVIAMAGDLSPAMLVPAAAYLVLCVATSAWVAWTLRRTRDAFLATGLIFVVHACYGVGVLHGLLVPKRLLRRTEEEAALWTAPLAGTTD